jgi:hypothetical protein
MSKIAKLVRVHFAIRVIVDENSDDENAISLAKKEHIDNINDFESYVYEVEDDLEIPYGRVMNEK